jgi:hypothetical protein
VVVVSPSTRMPCSGVTIREAVKPLTRAQRAAILAAR